MPDELVALAELATDRARRRQEATSVDGWAALADGGDVNPLLTTLDGAADRLSIGRRSVQRLVAAGRLPAVRVGGATRVRLADLDRYVDELDSATAIGEVG